MDSNSSQRVFIPGRIDLNCGDTVDEKYQIVAELGKGTFGTVYRVKDVNGAEWALKVLRLWEVPSDVRKSMVERFEQEYKIGLIECPNIVHSVGYASLNGNPYIVMEFCSGGDLCCVMGDSRADVHKLAADILNGLGALHKVGKVHRDLKPENVLLKGDGTAVLTDFGITGDRHKRMTERNIFGKPYQIFGTYAYMPPEQADRYRGDATVLPTTDLFSFGVLLYHLITGVLPFGELESQNDLVKYQKKAKSGNWDREKLYRTNGGKDWEKVIEGCLVPDYKKRLQNVNEVLRHFPQKQLKYQTMSVPVRVASGEKSVERSQEKDISSVPVQEQDSARATFISPSSATLVLRVLEGAMAGSVYDLEEIYLREQRRIVTLGRDRTNCIHLADDKHQYISRHHLTFERRSDVSEWFVRDGQWSMELRQWKGSSNGTYLNTKKVTMDGVKLKAGDVITIGVTKISVEPKS